MGRKRLSMRKKGDYWVVSSPGYKDSRHMKKSNAQEVYDARKRVKRRRTQRRRRAKKRS